MQALNRYASQLRATRPRAVSAVLVSTVLVVAVAVSMFAPVSAQNAPNGAQTPPQPEQRRTAPRNAVQPKPLLVPFPWRGLEKNGDDVDMPWSSGTVSLNGVRFNLVPTVENVRLDRKPSGLTIEARGLVPTGGWGDALLVPAVLIRKPEDGIYDIILYGRPPNGTATQAISEIKGTMNWDTVPSGARGVRVWSGSNCLEVFLPDVPIKKSGLCEGG